jgi:hypothetical protein
MFAPRRSGEQMSTMETATEYVSGLVESTGAARATDFDVPAIVAALHSLIESWDFTIIDRTTFWAVVATHLLLPDNDNPMYVLESPSPTEPALQ